MPESPGGSPKPFEAQPRQANLKSFSLPTGVSVCLCHTHVHYCPSSILLFTYSFLQQAFIEYLLWSQDTGLNIAMQWGCFLAQLVVQGWKGSVFVLTLTAELQYQHLLLWLRHLACHLLHQFCHPGVCWGENWGRFGR